jgi:LCP family protein required for cell wall assembly
MSQHSRLNPIPRPRRARRVPAYQVQVRRRALPAQSTDPQSLARSAVQPSGIADAPVIDATTEVVLPSSPESSITYDATVVSADDVGPSPPVVDTGSAATDSQPTTEASGGAAAERAPGDLAADDDFAEYARSVEVAAARSRESHHAPTATAADTVVLPAMQPVVAVPEAAPGAGKRARPASGRGGRGPGGPRRHVAAREPDPRPRFRRPKTWFIIAGVVFGVTLVVVAAYVLYLALVTYDAYKEAHVDPTPRPVYQFNPEGTPVLVPTELVQQQLPNWDRQDPVNILLMGIDEREGDEDPPRSDTIIVVRVDPLSKQVTMLSLPRDLLVQIPGSGPDKINAAYPIAEFNQAGSGPSLVAQTIEYNFGIRIHYFITIDFSGFREVVDTLGGVVVDVRAPVKDDQYPTDDLRLTRAYFPTGLQTMDGETALRYARTRHGDNDIARGDRQQQVLVALRQKIDANINMIFKIDELIREMGDSIRFDLNFEQIQALANLARGVDPSKIIRLNLWESGALVESEGDAFYWDADWDLVHALVDQYFNPQSAGSAIPTPTPPPPVESSDLIELDPDDVIIGEPSDDVIPDQPDAIGGEPDLTIPVIVRNASSDPLAATWVSEILYDAGFDTVLPESSNEVSPSTLVYDYVDSPATAYYIAVQLGLDTAAIVPGFGGNGIVVLVGDDVARASDE